MKKTHIVTKSQSYRINIPTGTVIIVEMYSADEIEEAPFRKDMAKNYYLNGVRRGSKLDLTD